VWCSVVQCGSVCCSVVQRVAVWCSVLHAVWCSVLQCVAVWRNVLRCVAVWRSALQCVAVCCTLDLRDARRAENGGAQYGEGHGVVDEEHLFVSYISNI